MNKDLRNKVLSKSNGKCWYCGVDVSKGFQVDHFLPLNRNRDGSMRNPERDYFDNLVPACRSCNKMKSNYPIETFRKIIKKFRESLNIRNVQYQFCKRYNLVQETNNNIIFYFERCLEEINMERGK